MFQRRGCCQQYRVVVIVFDNGVVVVVVVMNVFGVVLFIVGFVVRHQNVNEIKLYEYGDDSCEKVRQTNKEKVK